MKNLILFDYELAQLAELQNWAQANFDEHRVNLYTMNDDETRRATVQGKLDGEFKRQNFMLKQDGLHAVMAGSAEVKATPVFLKMLGKS